MHGDQLGSLWLYLEDGVSSQVVLQIFGNQGEAWKYLEINLPIESSDTRVSNFSSIIFLQQ